INQPIAQPPAPAPTIAGTGTFRVGADVQPGTYRSNGPAADSYGCYWERLSGFSGDLADIISNDFVTGTTIVTIEANDTGFSTSRCQTFTKIG
ncbi:hypothetical protein GTR00_14530, partial [Kineococcus sp. T90]